MKRGFLIFLCLGLALTIAACSKPSLQQPSISESSRPIEQSSVTDELLESLPPVDSQEQSKEESASSPIQEFGRDAVSQEQQRQAPKSDTGQAPAEYSKPAEGSASSQKPTSKASSQPQTPSARSAGGTTVESSRPSSVPSWKPPVTSQPSSRPPASSTPSSSTTIVPETTPSQPSVNGSDDRARQVFELVNQERRKAGLSELSLHEELSANAMVRAKEIVTKFDHTRPDGSKFSTAITIPYRTVGENIAWGQRTPKEVMDGWMNSSGHMANILNSSYTKIGVGVYESGGRLYWVQLFAG